MISRVEDRSRWALPALLRARARELTDKPFVSCGADGASVTYRQADELSDRVAAGLAEIGVGRGDRVLLMLGNRLDFVLAWFAVSKLGAAQVPINVDYRGSFLEHVANTAQAELMIVEDRFLATVAASRERLEPVRTLIVVGSLPVELPAGFDVRSFAELALDDEPPQVAVGPADIAAIHFTSGTTGRSKGALMPHGSVHLLCERNAELLDLDEDAVYSTELPLFHVNAQMTVYSSLLFGASARIEERFSATRWFERIRAARATHTSMLGVMVEFVLRQPRGLHEHDHALRSVWTVPCVPALVNEFRDRFAIERIVTSYGTTEVGMVANRVVDRSSRTAAGSVGTAFYDVSIVDAASGDPVPLGEAGEIAVRSKLPWTMMQGYFGMPERSVETFRDLWFHTGDVGRFDAAGELCFVDRLQDRIRRRGENVASADVEQLLGEHEKVAEAAVVAVAAAEGGEDEIKACLVLHGPAAAFDAEAFWAWCDKRLPYFAVPRYIEVLERLPKTPTEKVIKHDLRAAGVTAATLDRGPTGRARRP